jgi:hypothetical protein
MSGEESPSRSLLEAHESFIQHVEAGRSRIRLLSVITVIVAFLLVASYFSQLVLPLVSPSARFQTVDLLNPSLIATQVLLIILVAAWLYVGVANYLFASRLGRSIREIRTAERELEKRITG